MKPGRPSFGVDHVDSLSGSSEEKHRLKVILRTLTGELSVKEACEELSVGESRFHVLRRDVLSSAMEGHRPGPRGRPPKPVPPAREQDLLQRVDDLEVELQCAYVRTELALGLPHVLKEARPPRLKKKGSSPKKGKRKKG